MTPIIAIGTTFYFVQHLKVIETKVTDITVKKDGDQSEFIVYKLDNKCPETNTMYQFEDVNTIEEMAEYCFFKTTKKEAYERIIEHALDDIRSYTSRIANAQLVLKNARKMI